MWKNIVAFFSQALDVRSFRKQLWDQMHPASKHTPLVQWISRAGRPREYPTKKQDNWLLYQDSYVCVSKNRGTPQIIHFNRVFHYKPSILGYHYFWKHPYVFSIVLGIHIFPILFVPIFPLKHTDGWSILDEFPGARSTSAGDRGVCFRDHLEDLGGSSLGYVASNPLGGPVWEGGICPVQSPIRRNPKPLSSWPKDLSSP